MNVKMFVEGGGNKEKQKRLLRHGFQEFIYSGLRDFNKPRIILSGSRKEAYDDFCHALRANDPEYFYILLVDAEKPVVASSSWQHLKSRDGWKNPGASDAQCHLMVQFMEAWFYADPEALKRIFGKNSVKKQIEKITDVESIPKKEIEDALDNMAAKKSKNLIYQKINHGSKLLTMINVSTVRFKSRHCDHLFRELERQLGTN
jgi:hypothetical protein